jgi:effector-binding domain-containing protein
MLTIVLFVILGATLVFGQTAESKAPEAKAAPKASIVGEIAVKTIPAMTGAIILEKAANHAPKDGYKAGFEGIDQAYTAMNKDAFAKLGEWIKAGGMPMGAPFGIYYENPEVTPAKDLTCKIGFPTMDGAKVSGEIVLEKFPETEMAVLQYKGSYDASADMWHAIMKWGPEHGYDWAGPGMEVYLKGPNDTTKPEEYLTEIRMPVKKAEAKKAAEPTPAGK